MKEALYLAERERLLEDLRWIVRGRWVILAGLIFLAFLIRPSGVINPDFTLAAMLMLAATVALYNTAYWLYLKLIGEHTLQGLQFMAGLQTVVDQVIVVLIIHFTGGIESPDYSYLALTILIAGILYSPRGVMISVVTAALLYISVIWLEYIDFFPHLRRYQQPLGVQGQPLTTLTTAVVGSVNIFLWGFLAAYGAKLRRLRENQLRFEHHRVAAIIDQLSMGVIFLDNHKKLRLMNPAAEEMLGIGYAQAHPYVPFKRMPEHGRLRSLAAVLIQSARSKKIKIDFPKERILKTDVVTLRTVNDKNVGTIITLEDITREQTVSRLKSEFISIAAHQLRTPLSAIKWIVHLLLRNEAGPLTKQQREFLEKGYGANERMIRLVDDLLNVSRIEEGRFGFSFQNIDLRKLLNELTDALQVRARNKNLTLKLKLPSGKIPLARVDPERISLAIDNLLDNAIKYTPPGGTIEIGLNTIGDKIKIGVTDNGVGVPVAAQERLFTKFFRAENVRQMQTEGSGLGLFIVKNIVLAHGGKIWYEKGKRRGAGFFFTVKQAPPDARPALVKTIKRPYAKKLI